MKCLSPEQSRALLLWHKSANNNRQPIINLQTDRGEAKRGGKKRSARIRGDEREREGVIKGIVGGGKEREQPPAAAPTSGLINLMVSVDIGGLSKDGE